MRLTFRLPFPPADVQPNARCHWARKARAVKAYRAHAAAQGRRIPASQRPAWHAAEVRAVFYTPDARRRDPDNLQASLKAAYDGLRDAGILADDDRLVIHPPQIVVDRADPRVEVEVWPI